jgi:hypothetical protein
MRSNSTLVTDAVMEHRSRNTHALRRSVRDDSRSARSNVCRQHHRKHNYGAPLQGAQQRTGRCRSITNPEKAFVTNSNLARIKPTLKGTTPCGPANAYLKRQPCPLASHFTSFGTGRPFRGHQTPLQPSGNIRPYLGRSRLASEATGH